MQPNIALEPTQPLSFVTPSQRCAAQRQAVSQSWPEMTHIKTAKPVCPYRETLLRDVEGDAGSIGRPKAMAVIAFVWALTLMAMSSAGCAARAAVLQKAPASDDWSAMAQVVTGNVLRVELAAGRGLAGRLLSLQTDQVTIMVEGSQHTVRRAEIRRVFLMQRRTGQKARRGLLIGAIAGGLVGGLGAKTNRFPWAAALAAGWGGFGAAIGASDGFFDRAETLVYVAPNVTADALSLANPPLQPTSGAAAP
jgi:hypothetical protein